jgi:hypothetical protein
MVPFLTEWLIKNGTDPVSIDRMGGASLEIFYKAIRKEYLVETSVGQPVMIKLTRAGLNYLQEQQK